MGHVTPLMDMYMLVYTLVNSLSMYALVILQLVICLNFRVHCIYSMHMHHILTLLYIMHHIPTLLYMYRNPTLLYILFYHLGETHVKRHDFNDSKIYFKNLTAIDFTPKRSKELN